MMKWYIIIELSLWNSVVKHRMKECIIIKLSVVQHMMKECIFIELIVKFCSTAYDGKIHCH